MTMVIAPLQEKLLTGEELFALGDIGPCELVNGRVVSLRQTTSEHALVAAEMMAQLQNFIRPQQAGWVVGGSVGIYTKCNPDTVPWYGYCCYLESSAARATKELSGSHTRSSDGNHFTG